ncbi:MAG: ParA family protein [Acidobacteriota bacterium]
MKILAVYNLKGGVGKTASAVNLAHLAALDGARTLIWDLDPQGAASFYFRVRPELDGGRKALLAKKRRGELGTQIRGTDTERLDLIPADFSLRKMDIALDGQKKPGRWVERLLAPLADDYDFVFLDTPPSISRLSESIFRAATALLVPTIPTTLSLRTLDQLEQHLDSSGLDVPVWPFFSMVDRRKRLHVEVIDGSDRSTYFSTTVPYASDVERMGVERCPVGELAPSGAAAQAYLALWSEVKQRLLEPADHPSDDPRS